MIAHVVLFEPKAEANAEERQQFLQSLRSIAKTIPAVRSARVGPVTSLGLKTNNGSSHTTYSFAAILEFDSAEALETYLKDPRHVEFAQIFWKLCGATLIADIRLSDVSSAEVDALV